MNEESTPEGTPESGPLNVVAQQFMEGPIMIAAFAGWNDAGNAATEALQHLSDISDARLYDEIDPEPYVDFQVNRPTFVSTDEGRHLLWPSTRVEITSGWTSHRDIVLVHGVEPSMRWRSYYQSLLRIADDLECSGIIVLGALLSEVPHTRPIPTATNSANVFLQDLFNIFESTYEGPTGIAGVLTHFAELDGISTVSIWGSVPHYVPTPPAIKTSAAILSALEDVLGESIPRFDLDDDIAAWERGIDTFVAEDAELREYVTALEEATDAAGLPEATGESIAREFEKFLKRRDSFGQG
ncbi:PAC2 family protein [Timonella sp. A28]|uniref:PAC2 family protein n=1 Tax=Timonella sp. A28 TaxID=3442640 RepID=UPI003EBF4D29